MCGYRLAGQMIDFDIEILFLGGFDKRSAKCKSNNSRRTPGWLIRIWFECIPPRKSGWEIWNSNYDFHLLSLCLIYIVFRMPPDRREFKEFFTMRLSTEKWANEVRKLLLIELNWRNKVQSEIQKRCIIQRLSFHLREFFGFSSASVSRVEFIKAFNEQINGVISISGGGQGTYYGSWWRFSCINWPAKNNNMKPKHSISL